MFRSLRGYSDREPSGHRPQRIGDAGADLELPATCVSILIEATVGAVTAADRRDQLSARAASTGSSSCWLL